MEKVFSKVNISLQKTITTNKNTRFDNSLFFSLFFLDKNLLNF